jgi:two-component system chemotaxis response regulator CheB
MNLNRKIRVLVVDDSAVVRQAITQVLSQDPEIEVVGSACDPYVARDKILELNPDVLTLDIEMPRMDGLTFLRILQKHRPMPVVVVSSVTSAGSRAALEALEAGAVDVIAKPGSAWSIDQLHEQLLVRVKGAAFARVPAPGNEAKKSSSPAGTLDPRLLHSRQLIVFGASTGGTEALKNVLTQLPPGLPGICIVQHIPPVFSRAFAERLNDLCAFEVREARQNDVVRAGLALVAPGDYHMTVVWKNDHYEAVLNQNPALHHTRPAVDVLFNSAAACAGAKIVAVLLTGMGSDGASGMQKLKAAGAVTFAQNEATCVVYGMPRAAVELGVVDQVLPLDKIPLALLRAVQSGTASTQNTTTTALHSTVVKS